MRQPEFEAMIAPAKLYPQLWRLVLGLLLIVFCYLGGTLIVLSVAGAVVIGQEGPWGLLPFLTDLQLADRPDTVLTLLCTFGGMALGPVLAAAALHFRGPGSLLGPWGDWLRGFAVAFLTVMAVSGGLIAVGAVFDPPLPNLDLSRWLLVLPLVLPLLFLQIAAEELVFRGYLQQQLAARFRARVVWFGLPALVFALLHWDVDSGRNLPLLLLASLAFGLVAADLTERTGSLGAAMGFHFANNFLALLVLSVKGTITGLALYVTPWTTAAEGFVSLSLALSVVFLFVNWWVVKTLLDG